jgi:Ca2+-transporting ATPase
MTKDVISNILKNKKDYFGLTVAEANKSLKEYGLNSRSQVKKKTWLGRIKHIFLEPMMLLILITAVVYYFFGDALEAMIFFLAILPIGIMEYFQEKRTDDTVEALDKMMVESCKVYREEKLITVEVKNLVPGDLVYLAAGDKVPADGYLLKSAGLSLDEAILTGESNPVIKSAVLSEVNISDDLNLLKKGTLVVQGDGEMLVITTGVHTEYGKIGVLLQNIDKEQTPLQKKIYNLVRLIAIGALITAASVTLLLSFSRGLREGLLGGLTIAMSLIPEEIPIVFSVFLIMGVWRMAKKNALVRQMAMVETLGSATVICTDKTGTLTEGRMALEKIYYKGKLFIVNEKKEQPSEIFEMIKISLLSFERNAVDPLEVEMQSFAKKHGIKTDDFFKDYEILQESPFSSETKMVHHIWQNKNTQECGQYSVGAPEEILKICQMSNQEKIVANEMFNKLADEGYRVVGVSRKIGDCHDFDWTSSEFIGLLAMSDPPRAGVKEAITTCQEAGIRIIMITGDNKMVASHIAHKIGIKDGSRGVINGNELDNLSPEALKKIVSNHDIFSRVHPNHKYLIVEALKANGEIVAMTGDGVNDAPALKKADIGIAMGQKGTEVAREAAGIILLDDKFPTIVLAVKEGRRIYTNMRQAFVFLISFHIPIVGLAILPLFFQKELVFLPIHVIFLELICDPASVLGFQKEKALARVMKVPPRPTNEPIISAFLWKQAIVQGLGIFLVSFGFYYYFGIRGGNLELGRTMAFVSLVFSQILLIFLLREWQQIKTNKLLLFISFTTLLFLYIILSLPVLRSLFHLVVVNNFQYGLIVGVSFLVMTFISLTIIKRKSYV